MFHQPERLRLMLDVPNRYAHGFVAGPVNIGGRRGEIMAALEARPIREMSVRSIDK